MPFKKKRCRRWRQGVLTSSDQMLIVYFAIVVSLARGIDYITGTKAAFHDVIRVAFNNYLLGMALISAVALLSIGMLAKIHKAVFLGHGFLSLVYFVLTIGIVLSWDNGPQIFRSISVMSFSAFIHLMWMLRTGATPLESRESTTGEQTVEPKEAS